MLLSYQPDKSYKSFIVEYELSPQEFYAINSQDLQSTSVILKEINFDNVSVILESLNKSTIVSCTTTWKYTPDEGQLVGAGNDELAGWYVSSESCKIIYIREEESFNQGDSGSRGGGSTGGGGSTPDDGNDTGGDNGDNANDMKIPTMKNVLWMPMVTVLGV